MHFNAIGHFHGVPTQWPNIPILDVAETFANQSLCICAYLYLCREFWLFKYKSWCTLFAICLLIFLSSVSLINLGIEINLVNCIKISVFFPMYMLTAFNFNDKSYFILENKVLKIVSQMFWIL